MSVNVGQAVGYLTLDKNSFSAGLKSAGQDLNSFMNTTKSSEERINGLGSSMTAVGGMLTKTVTLPLVAVGAASVMTAANFEEGMSKVQAISGATGYDMELLRDKAKEMGATTKFSATESADALSYMAMAGWKTDQMLSGLPGIMNLAAASGESLALTSDIVTDAMTAFGLSAEESGRFADVLASASSNANTNVAMMGETFKYAAPVAGAMKYTVEDTAIAIGLMANSGIKASQAGTSLRQILMGLQGGVELTTQSTSAWRIETENSDGTMRDFRSVLVDLREGFADMTDAQKAQNAESIAGKVGMSGLLSIVNASQSDFDKLAGAIDNSTGSAEKMAKIMGDNLKGKVTIFKSALEGAGIAIGENLLPMLTKGVEKITALVTSFNELDEGTQETIVKFGMFALAAGPVLTVTGKLLGTFSGLAKTTVGVGKSLGLLKTTTTAVGGVAKLAAGASGVGGLSSGLSILSTVALPVVATVGAITVGVSAYNANQKILNGSILDATDNMSFMEKAMVNLRGATRYTNEELENMGLKYKEWNSDTSVQTQESLDDIASKMRDLNWSISEVNFDGIISDEDVQIIGEKTDLFCDTIIDSINNRKSEATEAVTSMFEADEKGISEQEATILDILNKGADGQIDLIEEKNKRIKEIIAEANKNELGITAEQNAEILKLQNEANEIALNNIALTEQEKIAVKAEFLTRANNQDLEGIQTLMAEKAILRDTEKEAINLGYNEAIELLRLSLAGKSEEEQKAINEMIGLKEQERDKYLAVEDSKWQSIFATLEQKYPEMASLINKYSGELLTGEDIENQKRLTQIQELYKDMNSVTETGMYTMQKGINGTMESVYVTVDETTGEIVGAWESSNGLIGGYTDEIGKSSADMGLRIRAATEKIKGDLKSTSSATLNASNEIIGANGQVITSLENVTINTDKTKTGILNLNGTPVKVQVNSDGAITNLDEITRAINGIDKYIPITIDVSSNYREGSIPGVGGGHNLKYATGSYSAIGGYALVGEHGPEIVSLKGGERIYNAVESERIANNRKYDTFKGSETDSLKLLINELKQVREDIKLAIKETGNTVNKFENVEVNGVTDLRELIEDISEYTEIRTI